MTGATQLAARRADVASGVLTQSGRPACFAGSHSDGQPVEHLTPAAHASAGREAWPVGGDGGEVVHVRPG